MALRAKIKYRMVGGGLMGLGWVFGILVGAAGADDAKVATVTTVRDGIAETERHQRDVLANIFAIGRDIRDSVRRSTALQRRSLGLENDARRLGQVVRDLEVKSAERGRLLNKRLSSLYRRRSAASALETLFSSTSPAELDRHRRYLKLLIDDDHRQMDAFVAGLREAKAERAKLSHVVRRLVTAQRDHRRQEAELERRMNEKSRLVAELRSTRDASVNRLRDLRRAGAAGDFAFFERRGDLPAPVAANVIQGFGSYPDPKFNFRLAHKGWFYGAAPGTPVRAIAAGTVGVARALPGWGPTVVIDHGDHYYSVYAGADRIKLTEGSAVTAGQIIGGSGARSPLFGPGFYFELRHFADAIDPQSWIKDPEFKTAERE